jgi:hypothetical protein
MACLGQKLLLSVAIVNYARAALVVPAASVTVVGEGPALVSLIASMVAMFGAAIGLADCLENAGRLEEAEALRREVEQIRRELQRLQP